MQCRWPRNSHQGFKGFHWKISKRKFCNVINSFWREKLKINLTLLHFCRSEHSNHLNDRILLFYSIFNLQWTKPSVREDKTVKRVKSVLVLTRSNITFLRFSHSVFHRKSDSVEHDYHVFVSLKFKSKSLLLCKRNSRFENFNRGDFKRSNFSLPFWRSQIEIHIQTCVRSSYLKN